jgi:hypothetical protein
LLDAAEEAARSRGVLFIRLEVASHNSAAIALYRKRGFVEFGRYEDYYEDHDEAVRMEKCIRSRPSSGEARAIPWVPQTTPFTCGPAALMMAMAATDAGYTPTPREEIAIWRESTTVFMTSGHGGCHPVGLALAAHRRGFAAEVWVSRDGPLFVDGVRNPDKKRVIVEVHRDFMTSAEEARIPVHLGGFDLAAVEDRFRHGANCLLLISTYRMNRRKAPHWVVLSGLDEACFYLQDPDLNIDAAPESDHLTPIDCHHLPVARDTLAAMARFGADRLQATVVISRRQAA